MTTDPQAFNANMAAWKKDDHTPWARLRRSLALRNLLAHVDGEDLAVLDAGGGNGRDSIPLAQGGHRVDLVDYSSEMLRDAQEEAGRLGVEPTRFSIHEAPVSSIPDLFAHDTHDVVLLHNVLSYVEDPIPAIEAATSSLRSGGLFSLMQVNRYNGTMQAAREEDLDEALRLLHANTARAKQFDDVPVTRYSPEELIGLLKKTDLEVIEHYGILCICGYIPNNDIKSKPEFFMKLERLETEMSNKDPYRLFAKFSHMISRSTLR